MKRLMLALLAAAVAAPVLAADFDKDALALHIRKALNLDSRTEIKVVEEPQPSPYGNLSVVNVTVGGSQVPVYITKDNANYFWGYVFEMGRDPDKDRAEKIDLKKVWADGSASAPVTIVEYSDLQCPACRNAHMVMKDNLRKTYGPDKVRVVFKQYPLNIHDWSERAAVAVVCAGEQGGAKGWALINALFQGADQTTPANLDDKIAAYAKDAKIDAAKLKSCRASDRPLQQVRSDKAEGTSVGVTSTPTFFINGRMRRGLREFDDLKVVIEEKLKEAGK